MDGGHNKGPPQASQGAKSVPRWWCERDKLQCAHTNTHTYTNTYTQGRKEHFYAHVVGKRSGKFRTAPAHRRPLDDGETSSHRSDVWSSLPEGWEWGAWQMPSSGQTSNCVKLLRWRFFHCFCFPTIDLRSLSPLCDAWQRRILECWWVSGLLVSAYNTTHHQHFLVKPCASAQKFSYYGGWVCMHGGMYKYINHCKL